MVPPAATTPPGARPHSRATTANTSSTSALSGGWLTGRKWPYAMAIGIVAVGGLAVAHSGGDHSPSSTPLSSSAISVVPPSTTAAGSDAASETAASEPTVDETPTPDVASVDDTSDAVPLPFLVDTGSPSEGPESLSPEDCVPFSEPPTDESLLTTDMQSECREDVRMAQRWLISYGYLQTGDEDGHYGPATENAVEQFQKDRCLHIAYYGVGVGPKTWAALRDDTNTC